MTDINKKIIEEATRYCENVKYVRKLDKYFCDLQRDFKALTSKLPVLLNRKLINKDELLFDLEISMDDLAVQIQSAMFKVQQQDLLYNKGARGAESLDAEALDAEALDDEALTKKLLPLFFTYLMAVDKNSIINKQNFGNSSVNSGANTFDSLLQTQSTTVNKNIGNNSTDVFIPPFIELD
jgi:hypothetical protein